MMQLVDSVTGASSTYTGPYTLRVLAGGTSMSRMETFNVGQNMYVVRVYMPHIQCRAEHVCSEGIYATHSMSGRTCM